MTPMINAADSMRFRAGRYVHQPTGYRAFIPAPLPPEPPLDLSGALRERLSEADYALGRLDGAVLTLPNPDLFVFMYVRKEAVLSSQIEAPRAPSKTFLPPKRSFSTLIPRPTSTRSRTMCGP